MKIQLTKRKFYNKWLYKATLKINGVTQFRVKELWEIIRFSTNVKLIELANALDQHDATDRAVRVERNLVDIYTNSPVLFDLIINKFSNELIHCFAPSEESKEALEQKRTILSSKLPHDRFRYKVFLQPHKINSVDDKLRWLSWLDTQQERIKISESVRSWFIRTNWNWDRRYMYVEDDQTLLLLKMRNSDAIGSVYTYTVIDK